MNETSPPPSADENHRRQMEAMQAEMRARMKEAKDKRGLVIVNTGPGKGKSTAAFGVVARTLAHGGRVVVVQFIKATPDAAEKVLRGPNLSWHAVGGGFTWDTQDRAADVARCEEGWALGLAAMADPAVNLIVFDELNVVLSFNYLPLDRVLAGLKARPPSQHVVITGRDAPSALREFADLVSEVNEIKHPFAQGVKAQPGIEY